jgi:hypothetical protein
MAFEPTEKERRQVVVVAVEVVVENEVVEYALTWREDQES